MATGGKKEREYVFKNPKSLTEWICWICYLQIIVLAIDLFDTAGAFSSELLIGLVAVVGVAFTVASAVLILIWIYRANANAHQLGGSNMKFTPGWSVGWYFIPIFWFWKPYQAMKEIWQVSSNPLDWWTQEAPGLIGWWWGLFLVSNVLSSAAIRMTGGWSGEVPTGSTIWIMSDVVSILAILVTVALIKEISKMQIAKEL